MDKGASNAFALHTTPRGIWTSKLCFRVTSLILCFVILGLSVRLEQIAGVIIVLAIPAGCAAFWNLATIICTIVRKNRSDLHPGLRVAIDLFMWLGFGAMSVLMASIWSIWANLEDSPGNTASSLLAVKVSVVLAAVNSLVHIALFIIDCHETHLRNRRNKLQQKT